MGMSYISIVSILLAFAFAWWFRGLLLKELGGTAARGWLMAANLAYSVVFLTKATVMILNAKEALFVDSGLQMYLVRAMCFFAFGIWLAKTGVQMLVGSHVPAVDSAVAAISAAAQSMATLRWLPLSMFLILLLHDGLIFLTDW